MGSGAVEQRLCRRRSVVCHDGYTGSSQRDEEMRGCEHKAAEEGIGDRFLCATLFTGEKVSGKDCGAAKAEGD